MKNYGKTGCLPFPISQLNEFIFIYLDKLTLQQKQNIIPYHYTHTTDLQQQQQQQQQE